MDDVIDQKYVGSCCGNRFVIADCRNKSLDVKEKSEFASEYIEKYDVDSALFIEKSNGFDALMEIFEKDGSESESCGNGTIIIAYLLGLNDGKIEMKDNGAKILGDKEKQAILMNVKFSQVEEVEKDRCVYVKMGEPHLVFLTDDIEKFDLDTVGKQMQSRYPNGINVDVIQVIDEFHCLIRTYERGVFAKTESCGTGSLSSYLALCHFRGKIYKECIEFKSSGGIHWVSREGNMLRLETLKSLCKIKKI